METPLQQQALGQVSSYPLGPLAPASEDRVSDPIEDRRCPLDDVDGISDRASRHSQRQPCHSHGSPVLQTIHFLDYSACHAGDLVSLIAFMLMAQVKNNSTLRLTPCTATRFQSQTTPSISVIDYLQRLAVYARLTNSVLLGMVCYIDRISTLCPEFAITDLTAHRLLVTTAVIASKVVSDHLPCHKTFARVGGVTTKELAILELYYLKKVDWRVSLNAEHLCGCYKSLVEGKDTLGRGDKRIAA